MPGSQLPTRQQRQQPFILLGTRVGGGSGVLPDNLIDDISHKDRPWIFFGAVDRPTNAWREDMCLGKKIKRTGLASHSISLQGVSVVRKCAQTKGNCLVFSVGSGQNLPESHSYIVQGDLSFFQKKTFVASP